MSNTPWKHVSEIRQDTLEYIEKRKAGLIRSIRTPWPKLNDNMLDGMEWGSLIIIAGRPGWGKTAVGEQILNEAKDNNPEQDFACLKFQFEMSEKMTGARELTGKLGLTVKQLFSADSTKPLTDGDIKDIRDYNARNKNDQVYQVSQVMTAKQITQTAIEFRKQIGKPFVAMIDHSILTKRGADESSQQEALYALSREIVFLKNAIPDSIWIILSQMKREIENYDRRESGKIANYPTANDIFGADALMQNCDATIALMRPDLLGIRYYGEQKFVVQPGTIVMHMLKNRMDTPNKMLFFRENLKYFRIEEADVPLMHATGPFGGK